MNINGIEPSALVLSESSALISDPSALINESSAQINNFIHPSTEVDTLAGLESPRASTSFGTWLAQEMQVVNQQIVEAEHQVQQLALGEQDNLHQVMLSLSKAKVGFELALQVRNKLIEGYQEVMRMQV